MGREIDSPPGAVFIEQLAGRLWVNDCGHGSATGSARVRDFPRSVGLYNLLPGRAGAHYRS